MSVGDLPGVDGGLAGEVENRAGLAGEVENRAGRGERGDLRGSEATVATGD